MRRVLVCLVAVVLLGVVPGAWATEGGGGAYPNGAEGFMSGAVPPPGNYVIDYVLYYSADELTDGDGNSAVPEFDLTAFVNVVRLVNVTTTKILGGMWAQHIFIPYGSESVEISVPDEMGGMMTIDETDTGFGDIIVDPIVLAWHGPDYHVAAGVDIYVPIGSYDEGDLANMGRNYWTVEPVLGVTYMLPAEVELSAKFMYDINMENEDTDYRSGQEFHFDYTVGKSFGALGLGVGGYYYQQVTEDEIAGEEVTDSEGSVMAWGPQASYRSGRTTFVLKYQMEMDAENRPEGEAAWFKLIHAL